MSTLPPIKSSIRSSLYQSTTPTALQQDLLNAAISMVFYSQNEHIDCWQDLELLFMQRAEHPKDPWSGHVAFPGGAVETVDMDTRDTAIRETQEELGFDLQHADWLGSMNPVLGPVVGQKKRVQVFPHIFLIHQRPELSLNEEAQSAFWVPMARLSQAQFVNSFAHPSVPTQTMFGIDLGTHLNVPLWGLSLEMLYQFFQVSEWPVEQTLQSFQS